MKRLVLVLAACHEPAGYDIVTTRDWTAHPALVSMPAGEVYAASDIHGGYARFAALLEANHLVAEKAWTGGDAVLVVAGDLIDKGPDAVDVIDLLSGLGDHAIVLFGNHEAEFFADPTNSKAESSDGIDSQITDPIMLASGADPRGAWLRTHAFGARLGTWFFSHAGNTKGRTFEQLSTALQTAFEANDLRDPEFIGDDSLLEARDWYADPSAALQAMAVRHIVFGHDPSALGPRGKIAVSGPLVRIDCGMSPDIDDSHGMLLHIPDVTADAAEQLDATGAATPL